MLLPNNGAPQLQISYTTLKILVSVASRWLLGTNEVRPMLEKAWS